MKDYQGPMMAEAKNPGHENKFHEFPASLFGLHMVYKDRPEEVEKHKNDVWSEAFGLHVTRDDAGNITEISNYAAVEFLDRFSKVAHGPQLYYLDGKPHISYYWAEADNLSNNRVNKYQYRWKRNAAEIVGNLKQGKIKPILETLFTTKGDKLPEDTIMYSPTNARYKNIPVVYAKTILG